MNRPVMRVGIRSMRLAMSSPMKSGYPGLSAVRQYSAEAPAPTKPRKWLRRLAWTVGLSTVGFWGFTGFVAWEQKRPAQQLPHDPKLPTLVVAGNGWGASSFLKTFDNTNFNVIVVSPRNFFLFTPLLPSVTTGTLGSRSIIEPTRFITRRMPREVRCLEGNVSKVDPESKVVSVSYKSDLMHQEEEIKYDYLVYAIGCDNNTFGIKGVYEHAHFLKEIGDARQIRHDISAVLESAIATRDPEEQERLLNFVVVGGGPTGVEYAAELFDFAHDDLHKWYPELAGKLKITLVEAMPKVLPMFSQSLIDYTLKTFAENRIKVLVKTMVQGVEADHIVALDENKNEVKVPYGLLVWTTGNTQRPVTRDLMAAFPEAQTNRRGILVDDFLRFKGSDGSIFAIGDCTSTQYAPTAQVASQQGRYLAGIFTLIGKEHQLLRKAETTTGADTATVSGAIEATRNRLQPFVYSHQGSLAYIGHEKAIADLNIFGFHLPVGGVVTYAFWRSVYFSQLFSLRNKILVASDWVWQKVFGRDTSRTN